MRLALYLALGLAVAGCVVVGGYDHDEVIPEVKGGLSQSSTGASVRPAATLYVTVVVVVLVAMLAPCLAECTRTVNGINRMDIVRCWCEFLWAMLRYNLYRFTDRRPPRVWPKNSVVIFCSAVRLPGERKAWGPPLVNSGIGGSEEAVIYLSAELSKLGFDVTVFNRCGKFAGTHDGVHYVPISEFNVNDQFNTIVAWRFPFMLHTMYSAKRSLYWIHDAPVIKMMDELMHHPVVGLFKDLALDTIDKAIVLSDYQEKMLWPICSGMERYPVVKSRNGVNLKDLHVPRVERDPLRVMYSVCYSRGLENLLNMWPNVLAEVPGAELHIFYGWSTVYDPVERARLALLMEQPGVFEHGRVGHREVAVEMHRAGIFAYPSHTPEAFSISTLKAQLCGCVPVVTDSGALSQVVKVGHVVKQRPSQKETNTAYAAALIELLKDTKRQEEMRFDLRRVYGNGDGYGWNAVALEWRDMILSGPVR